MGRITATHFFVFLFGSLDYFYYLCSAIQRNARPRRFHLLCIKIRNNSMYKFDKIVLNIPHSSTFMPINTWCGGIEHHIDHWCDKYTDEIFQPMLEDCIIPIVFPYSRFFCDAERLPNDPMEKEGQGRFYTKFGMCTRKNDPVIRHAAMNAWHSHQSLLKSQITPTAMVIDCHSFPTEVAPEVDICIGWNNDWSKPTKTLLDRIIGYFEAAGYKVGKNNPYSNSITPKKDFEYKSFMIEINKKLYLDEKGNKIDSKVYELNLLMYYLYRKILYKE